MFRLMKCGLRSLISVLKARRDLALENLALRQQLAVFKHRMTIEKKRPKIGRLDRLFWVILSRIFKDWQQTLVMVKPQTVIDWHRRGFRLYWRFKSRRREPGRPPISKEVQKLIKEMLSANTGWGAPRVHAELLKLGIVVDETTVSRWIRRFRKTMPTKPPSQTWRTFLENHVTDIVALDFFVVPTATFGLLLSPGDPIARPTPHAASECHRTPDGPMDGAASC
jgi:putative transposase